MCNVFIHVAACSLQSPKDEQQNKKKSINNENWNETPNAIHSLNVIRSNTMAAKLTDASNGQISMRQNKRNKNTENILNSFNAWQ